jgi:eukaryotic-like serine/threonine-protein kinase
MNEELPRTFGERDPSSRVGQVAGGKFRILREIGRGGMGIVYEAEDTSLMRTVALKFLPAGVRGGADARERFVREAQAASALDHPNICNVHEIGEADDGELFIAMSRYEGESLKDKLAEGPLEPLESVRLIVQVAEGLAEAHAHGIVHRDVKPGNIFVTSKGTVKILDFGVAKLAGLQRLTQSGAAVGTVAYMSPEQASGEDTDFRTDIWALGVVLYEMVTGRLPFRGERDQIVLRAILYEPPRPVKDLRLGFPAGIESLISRALSKDPSERFPSAGELAAALRRLAAEMTDGGYSPLRRLTFHRPHRRAIVVSGAALLSLMAVTVLVLLINRPSLAFEGRDKLLVADAENLTGDEVFDLALRTAIEADLQQSPFVSIFDKSQVTETLRLMRMDAGSLIDEQLGSEVCRFAGVRALLIPIIMSVGEAYDIQVVVVDPVRRRHVDRIRVTARGKEDVLLRAIDELTDRVRSRLGESLSSIEEASRPVSEVSTSSWDALNHYSLGRNRWLEGKWGEAATLMGLALEKDPQFVDARASLGLLYIQFLQMPEEGKEMLRQALWDAENQELPQRDVLKLRAANMQFVEGDLAGALELYRVMHGLFPDFMPGWNNAGLILRALGSYDEAVAMFEKAAGSAPRHSIPLQNLWFTEMDFRRNPSAAEGIGRRMVELSPELAVSRSFLGYSLAVQERFEEAEEELRWTLDLEPNNPYALPNLAHVLFASGRGPEAVPIYRQVLALARQGQMTGTVHMAGLDLALVLWETGETDEAQKVAEDASENLRERLRGSAPGAGSLAAFGMLEAASGRIEEAEAYLREAAASEPGDPYEMKAIAKLQALLGRREEALKTLAAAVAEGLSDPFHPVIDPGFRTIRREPGFRVLFKLPAVGPGSGRASRSRHSLASGASGTPGCGSSGTPALPEGRLGPLLRELQVHHPPRGGIHL